MKKKLLVIVLALALVFSFSALAAAADAALTVTVNGETAATYTLDEFKALGTTTVTYHSQNSVGTQEDTEFTGVLLSAIIKDVELNGREADVEKYIFTASDGFKANKDATLMTGTYLNGLVPMIAIKSDDSLQLVIPQTMDGDVNKSYWVSKLKSLTINVNGSGFVDPVPAPVEDVKPAATPAFKQCVVSTQKLTVNGAAISCTAYNIDGANYFMLRDIALALKDSADKFSVSYDDARRVATATSGEAYVANGQEWKSGVNQAATCVPSTQGALFNGKASTAYAYNIGGSNYFQLRGLGEIFGFGVDYDDATRTMLVTTSDYTAPVAPVTPSAAEPTGDVAVTINGVGYTYDQLAAAGAETVEYTNKKGTFTCLGAKVSAIVATDIPASANAVIKYSDYPDDTVSGATIADALVLYSANGAPIEDVDNAGVKSYVRLWTTKALGSVQSISW